MLTFADKDVLDALGLLDLSLVNSKDVKLCNVVHVDGLTEFWRSIGIGVPSQQSEEDDIGAIEKLLCRIGVDIATNHVPKNIVSFWLTS